MRAQGIDIYTRKLGEILPNHLGRGRRPGNPPCPNWVQTATFENNALTPHPTGFDSTGGAGAGDLSVNTTSALAGTYGFNIDIADTNARFGQFTDPDDEKQLTCEFLFDPNTISMPEAEQIEIVRLVDDSFGATYRFFLYYTAADDYQIQHNLINIRS